MIKRFRFGTPILTDSVVQDVAISTWENDIFTKNSLERNVAVLETDHHFHRSFHQSIMVDK